MPRLSDLTLKVGAKAVAAAYFRGQSLLAQAPLRIAAVGQRYGGGGFGGGGTTNRRGRQPILTGSGTLNSICLAVCTKTNDNKGDSATNYPVNFTAVYIEDSAKGTLTPVKLNGQTAFTVPGNTPKFFLDEISASSLGYPSGIPRGTTLFIRWDATQASTDVMYGAYNAGSVTGASGWFWNPDSGGTVSAVNAFGPITKTGTVFGGAAPANNIEIFGFIVCGRFQESNVRVGLGFGDSLVYGSNANVLGVGHRGFGPVARASFEPDGASNPIATLIIARPGNTADDMCGTNTATWTWFSHVTHAWEDLCTNDVGAFGGSALPGTYTTLLNYKRQIWAGMKAAGCKVATMIPLPNTTLTAPPSLTEQTNTSQWGIGGLVDNFRTTLLNEPGSNTNLDVCLQFSGIRDSGDRNRWGVVPPYNSNPQYHWGDGTTSSGEADGQGIAAAELRAFFLS